MASSLAAQLAKLSTKPVGSRIPVKPSLLFTSKEAAGIDLETIYTIGFSGLTELRKQDERFAAFESSLFSPDSRRTPRESRTQEANKELDESISIFLRLLSPLFLLKPAHKALEYLIRHYKIYEYNADEVMECILPYHETQLFVRMVQMINIKLPKNKRWSFLQPIQQEGVPLHRSVLVKLALEQQPLLVFICELVQKALKAKALSKTVISFYTATLLEILTTTKKITNDMLHSFLGYLLSNIKSTSTELQSAAYMIVSQISSRTSLSTQLRDRLLTCIIEHATEQSFPNALLCVMCMCQTQKITAFPVEAFHLFTKLRGFTTVLGEFFSLSYDMQPFLSLILDIIADKCLGDDEYFALAKKFLRDLPLASNVPAFTERLFKKFLAYKQSQGPDATYENKLGKVLKHIDLRYPVELDKGIAAALDHTKLSDKAYVSTVHEFITKAFPGASLHTSLFLSINHPEASTRLLALTKLESEYKELSATDNEQARQHMGHMLSLRLTGESADIVLKVLGMKFLVDVVPPEDLYKRLITLSTDKNNNIKVQEKAFSLLVGEFIQKFPQFATKGIAFIFDQLGHLLTSNIRALSITAVKSCGKIKHPLFTNLSLPVEGLEATPSPKINKVVVQLVDGMAQNIVENFERLVPVTMSLIKNNELWPSGKLIMLVTLNAALYRVQKGPERLTQGLSEALIGLVDSFAGVSKFNPQSVTSAQSFVSAIVSHTGEVLARYDLVKFLTLWNIVWTVSQAPSKKDKTTPAYVYPLLRKAFSILASSVPGVEFPSIFESFLGEMYEHILGTPLRFLDFFSYFWMHEGVTDVVAARALNLCATFVVSSQGDAAVSWQALLTSLLIPLSLEKIVRAAALTCLQSFQENMHHFRTQAQSHPKKSTTSISPFSQKHSTFYALPDDLFLKLVSKIVRTKDEFALDHNYLNVFVQKNLGTKKHFTEEQAQLLEHFLISCTLTFESDFAKYTILHTLRNVHTQQKLDLTHDYLKGLIRKASSSEGLSADECKIFEVLLQQFDTQNHAAFNKPKSVYLSTYLECLDITFSDGKLFSPRLTLISRISPDLFASFLAPHKERIFEKLCELSADNDANVQVNARRLMTNIVSSADIIAKFLVSLTAKTVSTSNLNKIEVLLELLRTKAGDLNNAHLALPPLMSLLEQLANASTAKPSQNGNGEVSADVSRFEYTKQMTLGCVAAITKSLDEKNKVGESVAIPKPSEYRVDVIVRVLQESDSTQTHTSALASLGAIASLHPAHLQSHVVPLCHILATDSRYDLDLLTSMVSEVVPPVLSHGLSVADLLKIFVDASPRIVGLGPRRLSLFTLIVHSVSTKYLYVLLTMLLSKHAEITITAQSKVAEDVVMADADEKSNKKSTKSEAKPAPVEQKPTEAVNLMAFCHELCDQFGALDVVETISQVVKVVFQSLQKEKSKKIDNLGDIFDPKTRSDSQLHLTQLFLLEFLAKQMKSGIFLANLASAPKPQEKNIQNVYMQLFENLLLLLARNNERKDDLIRRQRINQLGLLVLDRLYELLAVDTFIQAIRSLLTHTDPQLRRRSLTILNAKIIDVRDRMTHDDAKLFVELVPLLAKVVEAEVVDKKTDKKADKKKVKQPEGEADEDINKQTALLSLEILARNFARENPSTFAGLLLTIVKAMSFKNHNVVASALLCAASLCAELSEQILPYLPQFFPRVLHVLESTLGRAEDESTTLLQLSTLSSIRVIVSSVSSFLSPYLVQLIGLVTHGDLLVATANHAEVRKAIDGLLVLLAEKVSSRLLLEPIYSSMRTAQTLKYKYVDGITLGDANISRGESSDSLNGAEESGESSDDEDDEDDDYDASGSSDESGSSDDESDDEEDEILSPSVLAIERLLYFLGLVVKNMQVSEVAHHYKSVFKLLLSIFSHENKLVQDRAISAFVVLVLRLNEVLFKPLFLKVLDWAIGGSKKAKVDGEENGDEGHEGGEITTRTVFFYRLINALVDNLKTIFVPYYAYFWENCVKLLTDLKVGSESLLSAKKRKRSGSASENLSDEDNNQILIFILSALMKCFEFDKEDFVDNDRFEKLYQPLIGQLENTLGDKRVHRQRLDEYLIPCIAQLAITINNEAQWKPMNYQICLVTRHPQAQVRLAAVHTLHALYKNDKLSHKMLVFVPETVQFIAELMEDVSPEVENATQKLIATIDKGLGGDNSIASYIK